MQQQRLDQDELDSQKGKVAKQQQEAVNGNGIEKGPSSDLPAQELDEKPDSMLSLDQNGGNNNMNDHKSSIEEEKALAEKEHIRIRALSGILANLRPICGFMDENHTLSFYSSSLLIVYEGDREAPNPDSTSVKMIDFGRVRRQSGGDPGYNHGLLKFKNLMNKIHKEEKQRLRDTD